jgi:glycogen phosphorylase
MIRRTLSELAPHLLATRMVRDYVQQLYLPTAAAPRAVAAGRWEARSALSVGAPITAWWPWLQSRRPHEEAR